MNYYDTQGRYTELENLTNSINNNAVTTGVLSNGKQIIVFFDDPNNTDLEILNGYKLNQIRNIVVVLTGIKGDIKFLMGLLTDYCQRWFFNFQDVPTAAFISNGIADYIHTYTLKKNLRPLGGIILVADTISGHVFRIGVDSAYDRQPYFVVGKNSKKVETLLSQSSNLAGTEIQIAVKELADVQFKNLRVFTFKRASAKDFVRPYIT